MFKGTLFCVPRSDAIKHAAAYLSALGVPVTGKCAPDVTHLLLPVPSFPAGDEYLAHFLTELPDDVIISGGNLNSPLLRRYRCVDFLQDPYYLAENAAITADCTMDILAKQVGPDLTGKRVLVIGWGRIGKCLVPMLTQKNADVTAAARKASDLAMIRALGSRSIHTEEAAMETNRYDVILNTVPQLLYPGIKAKSGAVLLELASKPGMTGADIISARGLPGKLAPERSGKLIAETFIRLSI